MAIPAKFVLYCDYPGSEFRKEFDASEFDLTGKDEDVSYTEHVLCEYVMEDEFGDVLRNNLEKLMDDYFSEDDVPACGHICFDEVRTDTFGDSDIPLREGIEIYFAAVGEDGAVIGSQKIDVEDYLNLESEQERMMECGFWDDTDDYIETALGKFVDRSEWHFALYKDGQYVEDAAKWPAPKEDGSWIDGDGETMTPCVWFGNKHDRWDLDGDNLEFWQTGNPHGTVVEYGYDAFYGCYGGGIPGFDDVVERCPVAINDKDTPESIEEKIQAFFVKQYREAHKE